MHPLAAHLDPLRILVLINGNVCNCSAMNVFLYITVSVVCIRIYNEYMVLFACRGIFLGVLESQSCQSKERPGSEYSIVNIKHCYNHRAQLFRVCIGG